MTRKQLWNMKPALLRKSILTLGIAASTLVLTPSGAHAGSKELKALVTALNGVSPGSATTAQLLTAVQNAITANPKLKAGIIAGEALKVAGANATDFGTELGEFADGAPPGGDIAKFAADAAKTANTGKLPDGSKVVDFADAIFSNDASNTDALAAAKFAVASKTAAGQILGGRSTALSDTDALALANSAAADSKLKGAIQSVAQFVGANVTDADDFAHSLAGTNIKLLPKIAPGAAAGQPDQASNILEGLFAAA